MFVITSTFLSGITVTQAVVRSNLGLKIETRQSTPHFGRGSDENALQFRPVGLQNHANNNAADLLLYFSTSLLLFLILTKYKEKIFPVDLPILSFVLAVIAVLLTQSRAAYIALVIIFICVALEYFKTMRVYAIKKFQWLMNIRYLRFGIYILSFLLFFIIFDRALYSVFSFSSGGGVEIRDELFKEAIELFKANTYFGVGNGMFIPALFNFNPSGIIVRFPESVHNGFMLILLERGLLAAASLFLLMLFVFRSLVSSYISTKNWLPLQILLIQASLCIVMLFHPISLLLTPVLLVVLLFSDMNLETNSK